MRYERVFWDWNGTLLDDVEVCIESMNELLDEYGLPRLQGREQYHGVFGFPVSEYYRRLGFDFDKVPFERKGMALRRRDSDSRCFRLRSLRRLQGR